MVANGPIEPNQLIFGRVGCAGSCTVDMTRMSMLMVRNTSIKSSLSKTLIASGRSPGGAIGSPSRSYYVKVRMREVVYGDSDVR